MNSTSMEVINKLIEIAEEHKVLPFRDRKGLEYYYYKRTENGVEAISNEWRHPDE